MRPRAEGAAASPTWSGPGPVSQTAFKAVSGAPRASGRFDSFAAPLPLPGGRVIDSPLTLGTAGHVDHGKTALVAALTGVDTDRLPEEKARGLSIALGYAPLRLPSGRRLSLVDVPGHERFVRTMVAGATGIDCFLMVVAADDGVMPQTVEHAEVLRALGVPRGIVAITKCDLADPANAAVEAAELLGEVPVLACSARTGEGISELMAALDELAAELPSRARLPGAARLHIDRAFSVTGRGTVVTGTLWSGAIARGQTLELLPGPASVRVRGLEVHDEPVEEAHAGQRVAINLVGSPRRPIARGDALADPGSLQAATVLDCALELRGAGHGERVQVHHGTRAVSGRLAALGEGLWQLRLEQPLFASSADRVVVRRLAPPDTLGGGLVLDPRARRHGPRPELIARLRRIRNGETPAEAARGPEPHGGAADARERVRVGAGAGDVPREHRISPREEAARRALEQRLLDAGTSLLSEAQIGEHALGMDALRALRGAGRAQRVSGRLYAHADVLAEVRSAIAELIEREGPATLARVRDALGLSRKTAQAFLEHLDAARVTKRLADDTRVLAGRIESERRAAREPVA
jgi:selenocysteine-specific elongation factor